MNIPMVVREDLSERVHYNFPDYFAYIRKGSLSHYPNYAALSHWHDDIELICVLSGEMDYNINGEIVTLHEKEGIFVNARQLHYGFSSDRTECVFICVVLHPLLLCAAKSIEQTYIAPVVHNSAFPYQLLHPSVAWEKHILDLIPAFYDATDTEMPQLHIQSLFYELWMELYRNAPKAAAPQPHKSASQLTILKDMLHFIQEHYREKVTLADIAAAGNVGKSKCCTLFGQYLNQTPVSYLIQYRLQKSIELMSDVDRNITEIGFEAGFFGTSYFIETFHKHLGCSPAEYRAKYIESKSVL